MSWSVVIGARASRDLRGMDRMVAARILRSIERYSQSEHGDVEPLVGWPGIFRLRVGAWRVFLKFNYDGGEIHIIRVLHRSQAYR